MAKNRIEIVQDNLANYLASAQPVAHARSKADRLTASTSLTVQQALEIFTDQVASRLLDVAARELRKTNQSFYTISSAGHEQNAILGALLRLDDPCFLHYRSGGFMNARARKWPGSNAILETVLSFCASADDPISQGRHKVWGSKPLWVPPQTSTIASHLPKAAGMAFSLGYARKIAALMGTTKSEVAATLQDDSIICCSFGDASANHATALAGFNAARYTRRRGSAAPILFVCEDNGIGISVETPHNWIHDSYSNQSQLKYFLATGTMDQVWNVTEEAVNYCRTHRSPVFLHLPVVRLWGHAGTDVETAYRSLEAIEADEANDPLLLNARRLIELGAATPSELQAIIQQVQAQVDAACSDVVTRPKLTSVAEILKPLSPYNPDAIVAAASVQLKPAQRATFWGDSLPEQAAAPTRRTMAAHINSALADEMLRQPEILVFGEDVGRKGGVYHVTAGLQKRFGIHRCFDTLLDETTILGVAQGAAMAGLLPVPEIQYLAYLHNALDQLRGEACSLQFFSSGQFQNPMVVRVQGLAYQKGFGGHFHNDNSIGALRDIPGLLLATPARGDDAAMMLRGLLATAKACGRVAVFLEPIALYHEKDLYEEGDGQWLFDYPTPERFLSLGEVGIYNAAAKDILIVSYANGLRMSLRAAKTLREEHNIQARVLDLRWLNPLPIAAIHQHASDCAAVLVADECRATGGGIADAIIASLAEAGLPRPLRSVRSVDSYVPLGAAANLVLLSEAQILAASRELCLK